MSFIVPMEKPKRCGLCPCFHAEHPMYCQAVKADKNKRIYAPYGEDRPDWCPLVEVKEPHDDLVDRGWVRDSINHSCWLEHNDYIEAIGIVDDAPTIIEAEGSKE